MIDKNYPAPLGEALTEAPDAQGIEIEIEDPEAVRISADGMTIEIGPEDTEGAEIPFDANLAEYMDDSDLGALASTLETDIENDRMARKDWERAYIDGLKLLGLKIEERSEPWEGACGVTHPLITEAVVRFQSETIMETFPAKGPVLTKIVGKETDEKREAAARVRADMNYQLTEVMVEYRSEHEKMLWNLPATGSAFKKVYYDPNLGRQVSLFVPADDVLLPYGTSNIFAAHRVTHVMRKTENDLLKLIAAGFYRDVEIGQPSLGDQTDIQKAKDEETGFTDVNDERYQIYESVVDLNLKGFEDKDDDGEPTGIALPYVVTFIKGTHTVLSVRRNWKQEDPFKVRRQHFVHYQYIPGFGAYGFGLFHLIGGYAKSATSIMRQLVDAGTLSNLPGGLKSRGLRIKGDSTPISPGEFRDVDVASGNIKDNILPLPYKEPSQVLAALMDRIVEEGRRFAATNDIKISDMSAQAPVGTTLALLERQLKTMTAVQARVHDSMKQELKLLKDIIRDYADEDYSYDAETQMPHARKADFSMVEVIPVSDPNAATMTQRLVQYQAVIQLSQTAPQIYDLPQLHRGMLEVLGIKNAEKLVKLPGDMKPMDPVTENMRVLMGKPVKAFVEQDHEAHIAVHQAALQDPLMMQVIGQNPQAQSMMAAAQAHLAEHVAMAYRVKMEQLLGFRLPTEEEAEEGLDSTKERAMAKLMPSVAQAVLQQSQQRAQAMQAQQQAQDPVLQLQMREMAIKEKRAQIEEIKVQMEGASRTEQAKLAAQKLQLEAAERADRMALDRQRLQIEAASRADKGRLDERKQISSEELGEQKLQVESLRIGSLSRAADAAVRQRDQELALDTLQTLRQAHGSNQLGESRSTDEGDGQ
jgi:hypothetical protein